MFLIYEHPNHNSHSCALFSHYQGLVIFIFKFRVECSKKWKGIKLDFEKYITFILFISRRILLRRHKIIWSRLSEGSKAVTEWTF